MNPEFLFYANLVLALRLRRLLGDQPGGVRGWSTKMVVELLALVLFVPTLFLGVAAVVSVLANGAAWWWERRGGNRPSGHLLIGLGQLLALSVCFSPAGEVAFQPAVKEGWTWLASWSALGPGLRALGATGPMLVLFGFLLAANEANLVIRWMLDRLKLKPRRAGGEIDAGEYNRGRVIGLFERALIYFFVLTGNFGAIGFTLAAKGFTRFKEMEDRSFAEYVLIGTLLSSSLAMAVGLLVRAGL